MRIFESFFDDALVGVIVGCTKFYGYREKAHTSFEITNEAY